MTKIMNLYKGKFPRNIEKKVSRLLSHVPSECLVGLGEIVIVHRSAQKKKGEALGLYIPANRKEAPRIELAVDNIYESTPKVVFYLPFLERFLLANVLFHEIGHHRQFIDPRMKKKKLEDHAESFARKMIKKDFYWWIVILRPLFRLRKRIRRGKFPDAGE
jgi:hypothetical protein